MANSGQGFDGSQFFLVYGDSQLSPDYTVVGTIDDTGLSVLDAIAKNGNTGSNGQGDGAPTKPVTIQTMTVAGSTASTAPASSSAAPTS
jgi:peptidyl-prolyl cis-trans isomerase B (cyclophilin B)